MIVLTNEQTQQIEEVTQRALVILESYSKYYGCYGTEITNTRKALATIRAAKAQEQAEREPDLWLLKLSDGRWGVALPEDEIPDDAQKQAFYAAPQKREWVELLDEIDRKALAALCRFDAMAKHSFVKEIRSLIAAFKEANK